FVEVAGQRLAVGETLLGQRQSEGESRGVVARIEGGIRSVAALALGLHQLLALQLLGVGLRRYTPERERDRHHAEQPCEPVHYVIPPVPTCPLRRIASKTLMLE